MLAGGPRFPSSSAAPTPGAVRLARGDQRTSGLIPGTGDKCCTPPNAPLALGAVHFFRFRRRVGSSGLGWIPDGIGFTRSHQGGPSGHGAFFSMQAARSGIGTARRLLLRPVGRPRWRPPLSECASRDPRGEAFDGYQESAAPGDLCLDTAPQSTGEGRASPRSAWRGAPFPRGHSWRRLRPARTFSDDRPGWWARPGAAPPSSDSASRQPTGRGEAFDRYRDPRMAPRQAPAHSTGHDPTSLSPRLARRLLFTWLSAPRRWSPRGFTTRSDRA